MKLPLFNDKKELEQIISSAMPSDDDKPIFIFIDDPVTVKFKWMGYTFTATLMGSIKEREGFYQVTTDRTKHVTNMIIHFICGETDRYIRSYMLLLFAV